MEWGKTDIVKEISLGEDSARQFKRQLDTAAKLAEELCAFSNSYGGIIYVGVQDDGSIAGISQEQITQYNQLISNASNDILKPAIYPQTKTVEIDGKMVMQIYVSEGPQKPYCTSAGIYWTKSGSDKRKASPQELLRMFQQSSQLSLDETATNVSMISKDGGLTINMSQFNTFYEHSRGRKFQNEGITIDKAFENMNLSREGKLTLGGLLLFGENPQQHKPY
jgi:ATP-dependent DNA helicase RecG